MSVSASWPPGSRCRDGSRSEGRGGTKTNQLKDVQNTTVSLLKFDAQDQRFLLLSTLFFLQYFSLQRSQKAHYCMCMHESRFTKDPQMRGVLNQCSPHPELLNSAPPEANYMYLVEPNMASHTHTHTHTLSCISCGKRMN